jgi:HlyD family type I secretion membrane fusion protein
MAARFAITNTSPISTNAKTGFLDLTPPHWAARGLAYAILAIVLLGAVAAVVIQMPETVTARFVLVPVRGADPVKAARPGVVTRVFASEGGQIKQGELIATLQSEAAGDRAADWLALQTQLAGAGESLVNIKLRHESQRLSEEQERRKLEQRIAHLNSVVGHKRSQLELTRKLATSFETLFREGIVSQAQLDQRQMEVSEMSAAVEQLLAEQTEARLQIKKLELEARARQTEFKESERKFKEETATSEIRAQALKAGLADSEGGEVKIAAPCTGTVMRLHIRGGGAVVGAGETLAEIACAGEPLQAELSVPETGLGKLKVAQGVKLKYDAYPYQRFGVKYGSVAWLSPASSETKAGQAFKAHVTLADGEVMVKGQPQALLPGMSGQADIVIGKRSLVSYVFEPLRQLKENMSDVPPTVASR